MSDTEKQPGVSLQNVLQPREVDTLRAELSAALAGIRELEFAVVNLSGGVGIIAKKHRYEAACARGFIPNVVRVSNEDWARISEELAADCEAVFYDVPERWRGETKWSPGKSSQLKDPRPDREYTERHQLTEERDSALARCAVLEAALRRADGALADKVVDLADVIELVQQARAEIAIALGGKGG